MSYKQSFLADNLDFKSLTVNDDVSSLNSRSLIDSLNREFASFGLDSIVDSNSGDFSSHVSSSLNLNALLRNALSLCEKHKRTMIQLEQEKQKAFKFAKENELIQRRQATLKEDSNASHRDHLIMEEKMKLLEAKLNAVNKLNKETNEEVNTNIFYLDYRIMNHLLLTIL